MFLLLFFLVYLFLSANMHLLIQRTSQIIFSLQAKTAAKMKLDVEACAKIGRPAGSTWLVACSVNGAAPGQECTVVGKAEEDGQLQVLLSAGTSTPVAVAKSDLVTLETWRKRQAVRTDASDVRRYVTVSIVMTE
jgi:hypothetical protein